MKFSLVTIAYVFALLAAGMAVFGAAGGVMVTCLVLAFWAPLPRVGCAIALVVGLVTIVLPAVSNPRPIVRRAQCLNNLKQISLGLMVYENANSEYPRAAALDASGRPLHSWRTAILPYMEQPALHSQIALDEPWDSRINRGYTVDMQVDAYECPAHGSAAGTGHYLAVIGERTAWPPGLGRTIREVRDGTASTVMVIEAPWKGAAWAEPKDLSFDEAVDYLSRKPTAGETAHEVRRGFFYKPQPTVHVAFMDGHVLALPLPLPREAAAALLTVDGGEAIDEAALDVSRAAELDYGRCYAFGAFVVLAGLPWFRRRRVAESSEGSPAAR